MDSRNGQFNNFDVKEVRRNLTNFISKRTLLLLYFKHFFEDEAYYFNTLEFNSQTITLYLQENDKIRKR